jgi:hypothetical protein
MNKGICGMPLIDPEQERLKKLRDQQLAARDPLDKHRQLQQVYLRKNRNRPGQRLSLKSMWAEIPHIYKSSLYGFLIGLLVIWFLPQVWISRYSLPVSVLSMVVLFLIGLLIGNALDARDNIRDLTR